MEENGFDFPIFTTIENKFLLKEFSIGKSFQNNSPQLSNTSGVSKPQPRGQIQGLYSAASLWPPMSLCPPDLAGTATPSKVHAGYV